MKKLLIILLPFALSGCQALSEISNYSTSIAKKTQKETHFCLKGFEKKDVKESTDLQPFIVINYETGDLKDNAISSAWQRSHACREMYSKTSGLIKAYDTGGSLIAGTGGLSAISSGGNAVASTNAVFATLALAPLVLRDIANLDPQEANAFQALKAVTFTQCQAENMYIANRRFSLDAISQENTSIKQDHKPKGNSSVESDNKSEKSISVESIVEILTANIEIVSNNQIYIINKHEKENNNKESAPLKRDLRLLYNAHSDVITKAKKVKRELVAFGHSTSDDSLSLFLHDQMTAINMKWSENAGSLLPTPEQTIRKMIASPLTLSARIVSGESGKETISPEVAAVRFDYSSKLMNPNIAKTTDSEPVNWPEQENPTEEFVKSVRVGQELEEMVVSISMELERANTLIKRCDILK